MLKIVNNVIKLSKGDSAYIDIVIKNPTNPNQIYLPKNGDKLVFSLFRNVTSNTPIFEREFKDGILKILPSDTINLDYADYVYTVSVIFFNGDVNTIIEPTVFRLSGSGNIAPIEVETIDSVGDSSIGYEHSGQTTEQYYMYTPVTSTAYDYRVNTHVSSRLKGYLNNALVIKDSRVINYDSAENFPTIGTENTIYIDENNNAYKWDAKLGQYVQLNISADSAIHFATNLEMSATPPGNTNSFWIDTNDNCFIKYYDGALWRKSNLSLIVDPSCIDKHKWILIPDQEDSDDGSSSDDSNTVSANKWIVIPDE